MSDSSEKDKKGVFNFSMNKNQNTKVILTINASDSSSAGGMQSDLRTINSLNAYGVNAVTAIVAANTMIVNKLIAVPASVVADQISSAFDDFEIAAIKIGVLNNVKIIEVIAYILKIFSKRKKVPIVLDPAIVTKSNVRLLEMSAINDLITKIFPLVDIITPNLQEIEILTNKKVTNLATAKEAAKKFIKMQVKSILIKNIKEDNKNIDLYYDGYKFYIFSNTTITSQNDYGAGCTLSSSIATFLAQGENITTAIALAKSFLTATLQSTKNIGHGHGPIISSCWKWNGKIECDIEESSN